MLKTPDLDNSLHNNHTEKNAYFQNSRWTKIQSLHGKKKIERQKSYLNN